MKKILFTLLLCVFGSSIYANVVLVPVHRSSTEYPKKEWNKYIDTKAKLADVLVWGYDYTDEDLQYIIQTDPAIDTMEQAEIALLDYFKEVKIACTVLLVVGIFVLLSLLFFIGFIINFIWFLTEDLRQNILWKIEEIIDKIKEQEK